MTAIDLRRIALPLAAVVGAGALAGSLAAASARPVHPRSGGARASTGGTAYFAEQPETPPDYIFPLVPGAYFTVANVNDFQTLLYAPLYWYGAGNSPSVDYALSVGNAPVYSDGNRVVTITLKRYSWSDGERVSARDVVFWVNLLKAEKANWASYVPGGFPDNVTAATAPNASTVVLHLDASYNPTWFTDNELSQITPLPLAWDRTSLSAPAPSASSRSLPDATAKGARSVYALLSSQATKLTSYASSPLWSVVDGPWRLSSFATDGEAVFVPNRSYTGPTRPHLARFVELPFTSAAAELSALEAGDATGSAASTSGITVGYVPDDDLSQRPVLRARGYRLVDDYPFQFDYFEPNFDNPTVGPIFRQLYFRQAFQHLVDEPGWLRAFYHGLGVPTYGPIPVLPKNPWADASESTDPYPFSVDRARQLLVGHGWAVRPNATTSCAEPGDGPHECGAGIAKGKPLDFNLLEPSGLSYTDDSMLDLKSVASQVGITINLKSVPSTEIASTVLSCSSSQAACSWQLGQYGVGWVFTPDHLPTGEEIFQSGALGNVSNFSDPRIDKLIEATTTAPVAGEQAALARYQDAVRLALPDFWQPSPGTLVTLQGNLRGYENNVFGYLNPEDWSFAG